MPNKNTSGIVRDIWVAVARDGPLTNKDICGLVSVSYDAVYALVSNLVKRGFLVQREMKNPPENSRVKFEYIVTLDCKIPQGVSLRYLRDLQVVDV